MSDDYKRQQELIFQEMEDRRAISEKATKDDAIARELKAGGFDADALFKLWKQQAKFGSPFKSLDELVQKALEICRRPRPPGPPKS
jgi:hypothetical protein